MRIQLLSDWRMPMPTHLYAPTHAHIDRHVENIMPLAIYRTGVEA